jgi:Ca2+-binding RTX toxin-like protein
MATVWYEKPSSRIAADNNEEDIQKFKNWVKLMTAFDIDLRNESTKLPDGTQLNSQQITEVKFTGANDQVFGYMGMLGNPFGIGGGATSPITGFWLKSASGVVFAQITDFTAIAPALFKTMFIDFPTSLSVYDDLLAISTGANGNGSIGRDAFELGAGANTINSFGGDDRVIKVNAGNVFFDGGTGSDTLSFEASIGFVFSNPFSQQLVADLDGAVGKNPYGGTLTLKNVENVIGTPALDKITGNASANIIGDRHIDYLAFDIVDGKGGDDTVYIDAQKLGNAKGGTGFDNLVVMQAATIDLQDTAFTSHVSGFEKFTAGFYGATNSATLRGDASKNWFVGNFGVDILQGRGGDDTLDGGTETAAEDVAVYSGNRANYSVKAVGATVTVTDTRGGKPDGIDTLYNMETLRFADGDVALQSILPKLGNVVFLGDPLSAGASSNNDSLYGTATADTLWGQGGKNLLEGGKGDDTYVNIGTGDTIVERAGGGNDTITTFLLKYSLAKFAHVENLTGNSSGIALTGYTLTGNASNNVIKGNFKKDTLNGGAGNDSLQGGFDADKLNGGTGRDTADYSDKAFAVTATLKGATASTVVVAGFNEKDTIRNIENLTGGSKNDTFTGDGLANTLSGNDGNDRLSGAGGKDTLIGGKGADHLKGGTGADSFVYTATNQGKDFIDHFDNSDLLKFKGSAFAKLKAGEIKADNFLKVGSGHAAKDAEDRFIFNTKDDTLWFDKDGTGTSKAVLIADFTASGHDVVIGDILIV